MNNIHYKQIYRKIDDKVEVHLKNFGGVALEDICRFIDDTIMR